MCTVVVLRRPDHAWPLLLAANRDEMAGRPWLPPARHWPDRHDVIAGIDQLAGGTWLGLNDTGVVAGLLNRKDSLGPDPRLRTRGELVLEALDHADAVAAAHALTGLDGRSYRSFNMVIADNRDAFWLRSLGEAGGGKVEAKELPPGLSMLTSRDLDDPDSPRIRLYRPRFEAAAAPDPDRGDWSAWEALLAHQEYLPGEGPGEAMTVITDRGFGTLSSSLIALPAIEAVGTKPIWRFAAGRPGEAAYEPVEV
ncbi:MAG: NRDE family protein [Rhodospirillaceae bacterium]